MEVAISELMLFAALGVFIIGLNDLLVDLLYFSTKRRRIAEQKRLADMVGKRDARGPLAVFIPAWQESRVIGPMLESAVRSWGQYDYRLYVGHYPNDPETGRAIAAKTLKDGPITPVLLDKEGPTTKADCLNALWRAMLRDEMAEERQYAAVIIHDAEDVVDPQELQWFGGLLADYDMIQLPVVPLADGKSRWISGHYLDEFAQGHMRDLPVRQALGLSIPGAGVGCCIARNQLLALAEGRDGPFDPASLTEDYEMGLSIHAAGGKIAFVSPSPDAPAVRSLFPATLDKAVRQKARWIAGIALEGWDRTGWRGGIAECWIRMCDRLAPIAAVILLAAYLALIGFLFLTLFRVAVGESITGFIPDGFEWLIVANSVLLLWRLAMRFHFTSSVQGWREGIRAVPRAVTANIIAMMAARRALGHYLFLSRRGLVRWDKTEHVFPPEAMHS